MFDIRLPSRDLIADSIEAVCDLFFLFLDHALAHHVLDKNRSHWYDDENINESFAEGLSKTSAHFFSSLLLGPAL
jgi:hypothetical protein